jgi:hypothetical protein
MAPCKVTQSHQSTSCTRLPTLGSLTGINQPTTPLAGPDEVNIPSQLSTLVIITSFYPSQSVTFEGIFRLETSNVRGLQCLQLQIYRLMKPPLRLTDRWT